MQHLVAQIAVSNATFAIDKPYDYLVPASVPSVSAGMRVMVPFGRGDHMKEGVILALRQEADPGGLKSIAAVLDEAPVLDADGLQLALWMHDHCFCTVYDAVKTMLPTGLWYALQETYQVAASRAQAYEAAGEWEPAVRVLDLLFAAGGSASLKTIQTALGGPSCASVLRRLRQSGVLTLSASSARRVGDRTVGVLRLSDTVDRETVAARQKRAPSQYAVFQFLSRVPEATAREIRYFTGVSAQTVNGMVKAGLLTLMQREQFRRPDYGPALESVPLTPNEAQAAALSRLLPLAQRGEAAVALLYGVTGSGKTLVYLHLIRDAIRRGKTAMLLVPEIALTPQLLQIVSACFGSRVAVLHSALRTGERYDEWRRIRRGEVDVVVGTRSAVFAPLPDLGLIVMDEEQEPSYQSDQSPRYHTREIAKYRCVRAKALLLLGSATPSVESHYHAKTGTYHLVRLPTRYNEAALPNVILADMKEELRQGNGGAIGSVLRRELEKNIQSGQQSILYLNRRGNSQMVTCGACGAAPSCPHCSVYLTYHSANGRLMCHHCGHSQPLPEACPACGGMLKFIGLGTQKVEQELNALFPGVEILRMDADTVSAVGAHQSILDRFAHKKVPILLGTQMVAKGLDFPSVTLVGVISADLSLYMDDFRAGERTFSLLTQVVGRAGRGDVEGRAVIQTYTPDHEVIVDASKQDYDAFYETEIALRKMRDCPPFCDLFGLTFSGPEEAQAMYAARRVAAGLEQTFAQPDWRGPAPKLWGPAPARLLKLNDRYRYRLLVVAQNKAPVRRLLAGVCRAFWKDPISRSVSLSIEINGEG